MENLKSHVLNRIKTMLISHDMNFAIDSDDNLLFKSVYIVLYYNKEPDAGLYFWANINNMLFSKDNIFYVLYKYFNFPEYICQCSGTSLEELAMKMDLMGI
jgi:hypothetical protein